jgi:hypothetical protein
VSSEADHERRDELEFTVEGWQRLKCFHPPENALQSKRPKHLRVHGHVSDIEPERVMAEPLADVEEIAGSRTNIENVFPPPPIKLELVDPAQIDGNPPLKIEIFPPTAARIFDGITLVDRAEFRPFDARDDLRGFEAKNKSSRQEDATEVMFRASGGARIGQF